MNFEIVIIMFLSYGLGVFTIWIKRRCETIDEEKSSLPLNCPYVEK